MTVWFWNYGYEFSDQKFTPLSSITIIQWQYSSGERGFLPCHERGTKKGLWVPIRNWTLDLQIPCSDVLPRRLNGEHGPLQSSEYSSTWDRIYLIYCLRLDDWSQLSTKVFAMKPSFPKRCHTIFTKIPLNEMEVPKGEGSQHFSFLSRSVFDQNLRCWFAGYVSLQPGDISLKDSAAICFESPCSSPQRTTNFRYFLLIWFTGR